MRSQRNTSHYSEQELLFGLKQNNIRCYEILFQQYYAKIHAFIRGMLKDSDTAEDIAQNVFLKVWLNRHKLDEQLSLKNYLYVLARNEVLNHLRNKNTSVLSLSSFEQEHLEPQSISEVESLSNLTELQAVLEKAIESLPPKRQEVFRMSRFRLMSNKEIAEELDLSVRTVDKHIELALREIRKKLSPFLFSLLILFYLF